MRLQAFATNIRFIAIPLAAALAGPSSTARAAGATVPDFGPGGALVMLALHGAFYLLVFAVLPATLVYAGYRLVTGTRLRVPAAAALKSRYAIPVAALIAWVAFVAIGSDGFSPRHMPGWREWAIFAGTGALAFGLPLFVMALLRREKSIAGLLARVSAVAVVGVLASSAIYTAVERQSADRAHALLEDTAAAIYAYEAAHGETPARLDELPGNPRRSYLCRRIEFDPERRRLALDIYVTERASLMYRLSFGCLGRFSRGETITRSILDLQPKVTAGLGGHRP